MALQFVKPARVAAADAILIANAKAVNPDGQVELADCVEGSGGDSLEQIDFV
jgi:hypothetical protein